ncbi:hypothetical protein AMATHDRAFT_11167 [Amanita thiersii Skay4041]|uniref:Uncharacterized protein n=1 Tax=Amanita thiersii Skay4041 TaxID=703135 RepID=A0A2A9N614_9AGAR|nr:hypothetical protein AMATHDRAFT_11167 [Amanita thiersii Skay4041]
MSDRGYLISPSSVEQTTNAFSTAISSLRSTFQQESATDDALQYIDSVVNSRTTSPQMPHAEHEGNHNDEQDNSSRNFTKDHRSHSVTPKASPLVSPKIAYRPSSTDNNTNDNGYISRMRSAAFDESQNIAQLIPSHPPPPFLTQDFTDSNINFSGTLLSLPALMDKPNSSAFTSSTDPTFVLQNIYATNVNNMLQSKGYVPLTQAKDMGKALAMHIRTSTGSGFDTAKDEHTIQTDLLARIITYAAMELNTEITDYSVASHSSTIPLIIYREVQEDWDFSGNSDNFLISNTTQTIQDDLDEAFTNRLHKNIMVITTPASSFNQKDKHLIMDSIANETPLPEEWSFTDEKGHKRVTHGWLTGINVPKTSILPATTFSPNIGQKRPLETDHDTEEANRQE